jgi:hypothetical protein
MMRAVAVYVLVAILAMAFGSYPTHAVSAHDVSATVSDVGSGCFEYNFSVTHNGGGPPIRGFAIDPATSPTAPTECHPPTFEAPTGWSAQGYEGGPNSFHAQWQADSRKLAVRNGRSLSGFKVTWGTCPLNVVLWATTKDPPRPEAVLDSDSFVVPCPLPTPVATAVADLAARLGIGEEGIDVQEAMMTWWSDSCLGVHYPGMFCLAVMTPGYWVALEALGDQYIYHTDCGTRVIATDLAEAAGATIRTPGPSPGACG